MKYYVTADVHGFYTELHRALDRAELAGRINALGGKAQACVDSLGGQVAALQAAHPDDLILICGSLYLAAQLKADIKKAEA